MKPLKIRILYSLAAAFFAAVPAHALRMDGGDYEITKTLINGSGSSQVSGGNTQTSYELGYAVGEPAAGYALEKDSYVVISGYFGGRFGLATGLTLTGHKIGARAFYQHKLQVGVPYDASITLMFSDPINPATAAEGILVRMAYDHLGQARNSQVAVDAESDAATRSLILKPQTPWLGNTLYEVLITQNVQSVDGFTVDTVSQIPFATLLDPSLDNVVLHPLAEGSSASAGAGGVFSSGGGLQVRIPPGALPEQAMVLFNDDPLHDPIHVDPKSLEEATRKAQQTAGSYRTPVSLQEIQALNATGERLPTLAQSAEVSLAFDVKDGMVKGPSTPVRPETLSLWTLDEKHQLWVKLPASQLTPDGRAMRAAVPHFSVYALMGGPSGSTADVFAFPVPWRPFGPNAGEAAGQTGSLSGGITFSNLPSECTIRIYTLSGDLVRTLQHSDTGGSVAQERWDGRTDGGDVVASGVYLWRAQSHVDGKNGKLMVIR